MTSIDDEAFTYTQCSDFYDDDGQLMYSEILEQMIDDLTIWGSKGSYAQTYAKSHKVPFKVMPLQNNSYLANENITLGKKAGVVFCADSGTAPYKYSAAYKKRFDTNWTTLVANTTDRSVYFVPQTAGVYDVRVTVKDDAGTVVRKNLSLTVLQPLKNNSEIVPECRTSQSFWRIGKKRLHHSGTVLIIGGEGLLVYGSKTYSTLSKSKL